MIRRLLVDAARAPAPAHGALFLVGGYDGSGNYGDMVQLQAALELLAPLAPSVTPIPVLLQEFRESHAELAAVSPVLDAVPVCFADSGAAAPPEGMRRLELPAGLAFGGVYLYGGGYLNARWGDGKLSMAEAAEAAVRAAGAALLRPMSSGLQVDRAWAEGLEGRGAALLRRLEPFGVRDEPSIPRFAERPLLTGDDAVGVLAGHAGAGAGKAAPAGELRVNVHLQDGEWVTADAASQLDFVTGLLEALEERTGAQLAIQPVIAYDDRRISERPGVERLAAHPRLGPKVAGPPVVLRPGDLTESLATLSLASLTICCSYHVALTSDLLGVPAALLAGNAYYEQKAAGLAAAFGLPAAFTLSPRVPAGDAATALVAALGSGDLRLEAGEAVARRRSAERDVLASVSARALAAALGRDRPQAPAHAEALAQRLDALRADHASLLTTCDRLGAEIAVRDARVEEKEAVLGRVWEELLGYKAARERFEAVQRGEREASERVRAAYEIVLASRSWRFTGPLRRGARVVRRDSGANGNGNGNSNGNGRHSP